MIIRRIEGTSEQRKKRVGAYARVSTDKVNQEESFETQCRYYEEFIRQNPDWEFVRIYADPGKSGISADKRLGFQQMMEDARAKQIDIIFCKSISRFARNVQDAQRFTRELKVLEVEVRFEREALSTFDSSAEIIFNILAAVAQEESRSISENVKWSYRKNAEKGIRRLGKNRALGYNVNQLGELVPNGDAWIVQQIFGDYANGLPLKRIIENLSVANAKRLRSDGPFTVSALRKILQNELYVGDRRLQKKPPTDYLTKLPDPTIPYTSYYITDAHEPIVDREIWERAQMRLVDEENMRVHGVRKCVSSHLLYGRLYCAECGAPYKRRTVTDRKGRTYKAWNCAEREKGKKGNGCRNIIIREDELLRMISDRIGWTWEGAERFYANELLHNEQRIAICHEGVRVDGT